MSRPSRWCASNLRAAGRGAAVPQEAGGREGGTAAGNDVTRCVACCPQLGAAPTCGSQRSPSSCLPPPAHRWAPAQQTTPSARRTVGAVINSSRRRVLGGVAHTPRRATQCPGCSTCQWGNAACRTPAALSPRCSSSEPPPSQGLRARKRAVSRRAGCCRLTVAGLPLTGRPRAAPTGEPMMTRTIAACSLQRPPDGRYRQPHDLRGIATQ